MSGSVGIASIGRWIGYGVLVASLPIALFAATMVPNEYVAMGSAGIDCDGPAHVYLFALPAYAIYGAGALVNAFGIRRRRNIVAVLLCVLVCVAITPNFVAAVQEQRMNDARHACE